MELITWRGTPGVGDFMWALNSAHNYAYRTKQKVNLEFQWEHSEDYLHHFEDPETIIERLNYVHNFYHRKDDVEVTHVFNAWGRYRDWKYSDDLIMTEEGRLRQVAKNKNKNRFWFESGTFSDEPGGKPPNPDWTFREDAFPEIDRSKVVIWTPKLNAEVPRTWKNWLTSSEWDDIISSTRRAGFNVIELNYRTPISEAMYHISTCRQVICYDGMWHYIARNFQRPIAVISSEGVTRYHTPHALRLDPREETEENVWWWMDNIAKLLGTSKRQAVDYGHICKQFYK
jgi:hypothetical protein